MEWMVGLPAGWVTAVPNVPRNALLKGLGNIVVPQQAAAAFRILLDRAGMDGQSAVEREYGTAVFERAAA